MIECPQLTDFNVHKSFIDKGSKWPFRQIGTIALILGFSI